MGQRKLHGVLLVAFLPVAACDSSKSAAQRQDTGSGKGSGAGSGSGAGTADDRGTGSDLEFEHFEFGPYMRADWDGKAPDFLVQAGYTDLRRQNSAEPDDHFDWLETHVTAQQAAQDVKPMLPGCSQADAPAAAAAEADRLEISGPATASVPFAGDGAARWASREGLKAYDISVALAGVLKSEDGKVLANFTIPAPPAPGTVQLSGAFDHLLSRNLSVRDLSEALSKAEDDLVLADIPGEASYDLAVVTFYGRSSAAGRVVRCVLPRDGSTQLQKDLYQSVVPLKGFFVHFAGVTLTEDGVWTSAVAGEGTFDKADP